MGLPSDSDGKEAACNEGDPGSIPGLIRSPGEENGYPFKYSHLQNSMDREDPGELQSMGLQRLLRSKCLLISWMQSLSTVILEPPKINSVTTSSVSPSICHNMMGLDAMISVFLMLSFKPAFSFSSFTLIKRLFSSS